MKIFATPEMWWSSAVWFGLSLLILQELVEGDKSIFDKFQQSDYTLKVEWGEVVRFNKQDLKCFHGTVSKYNRTAPAGNLTFEYNFDIGNALEIIMQLYKFASNEYRLFPLRFQVNFCYGVGKNLAGSQSTFKCGNFSGCPLTKGRRYHICNWMPNQQLFPPFIPNGKYMLEAQGLFKTKEMFLLRYYGSVVRPEVRK